MSLQELFGIRWPLIQAPMAGVQGSALAVAVSNAGGLGSLPCGMLNAKTLHAELSAIAAQTDRPYNVNFFCHTEPQFDAARETRWRELLAPYYLEYAIEATTIAAAPARTPFNAELAELIAPLKPPVVSFHFGLPAPGLLRRVKSWGAIVLSSATTVAEARWLEAHGADVIIAQGLEAGGHRGHFLADDLTVQLGTFALLPQIVRAVKVPVIAAGGIVDARGVAAAQALGAAGVQIGTAYMLCPEATTSAVHRAALQNAAQSSEAAHTALTNLFTGRPARSLVNRFMRELGPVNTAVPEFPLASAAIAPLRQHAEQAQSGDFSPLWCGQNASGCRAVPAAQLTRELAAGWCKNA